MLGKCASEHVDAMELAHHAGAEVRRAGELTSLANLSPFASPGRTQSDIAHEVAHLLLQHSVNSVETIAGVSFYTCDPDEEQEANWLADCLLLPRPLVLQAAGRGMDSAAIAEAFNVSEAMAAFRLRTTGVERQLTASHPRR